MCMHVHKCIHIFSKHNSDIEHYCINLHPYFNIAIMKNSLTSGSNYFPNFHNCSAF